MRSKNLLKALSLSLMAALGLLALMASSASAEDLTRANHLHGSILVNGSEHLLASFTGSGGSGQLLAPALNVEIKCNKSSLNEGQILQGLKSITVDKVTTNARALVKVEFEECKAFEWDGTTLGGELPCTVTNAAKTGPPNISATAILLPTTHNSVLYIVAEPDTAEPLNPSSIFTTVTYKGGTGCPIPLTQNITGSYTFEVTQTHEEKITITPGNAALQTLMGTALKYGVNAATLDNGAATGELAGAHAGKGFKWGVI